MISRRDLVFAIPPFVIACIRSSFTSIPTQVALVTRSDLDKLLDTTHPELHCKMNHNHNDTTFDDWKGSMKRSATDCGHNEGAGAVIKLAVKNGLSYPELVCRCPDSENLIPEVNEVLRNPDALDQYAGVVSPFQIADIKNMLKRGVPPTQVLASAPEEAVGEVWSRKAMMRFASTLAKKGSLPPAVAIATASQWHNCQAFRCLLHHPSDVAHWLQEQRTQECNRPQAGVHTPQNLLG